MVIAASVAACSESEEPLPVPPATTYHQDIAPLVAEKCGGCHVEGGIAPQPFQNYAQVFTMRKAIQAAVKTRIMPPWMPAQNCSDYEHDRSLSEEQIALISDWVDEGGAEGDPAGGSSQPPRSSAGEGLPRVDLELAMPTEYSPDQTPDDYRCFLLDWPESEISFVTGFRGNPGRPSLVHHIIAFLISPEEAALYEALDAADPKPGYTCFGGPGGGRFSQAGWLGIWGPGSLGTVLPAGTGIPVRPGSKIALQVHYSLSSAVGAPDRTSISLTLERSVQKIAIMQPWLNPAWLNDGGMPIPAGQKDVRHRFSFDVVPVISQWTYGAFRDNEPITVYSSGLHMHTRGAAAKLEVERATGASECMLNIPRWDFHWQSIYTLSEPKVVRAGDRIALECQFDNSEPNAKDLGWGEGTNEEMCFGTFLMTQ
uniref:Monooxygenase n=1 Tax=Stigmatella aurantiaca Sg a15 TaxID=675526 RepID=A0A097DC80_STIAU|nr:monooxygenase [Stigmatella aurantiaca Sg a15]